MLDPKCYRAMTSLATPNVTVWQPLMSLCCPNDTLLGDKRLDALILRLYL